MGKNDKRIEIQIAKHEHEKRQTAAEAFCKVCNRLVEKLPHVHDEKINIKPGRHGI